MGAGRKTETYWLKEKSVPQAQWPSNFSSTARNLRKNDLGGVIFGCKHSTFKECILKQLFGLPAPHFSYVQNIKPGLPLFLFNYSDRKLHGIFEAASAGQMNINPHGWTADESDYTLYPAQVKIRVRMECQPLVEDQFGPIITDNYYEPKLFWFELDRDQTEKLISLFSSFLTTVRAAISANTETSNSVYNAAFPVPNRRREEIVKSLNVANPDQTNTDGENRNTWSSPKLGNSNRENGNWVHGGLDDEERCLEAIDHKKSAQTLKTGVINQTKSCDYSYSSAVQTMGTSHPRKFWSELFKGSNAEDAGEESQDIKLPSSGSTNLSISDDSSLDEKGKCLEVVVDDSENYEEYMNLGLINELLNSPVKKEGYTYFTSCTQKDTIPTSLTTNKGPPPHLEFGRQPLKAAVGEDTDRMIETMDIMEMNASDFNSIFPMLLREIKELKSSLGEEDRKINLLEHDMVKSRLVIQLLKDRCIALENQLFKQSGNDEQEESESINDLHPNLDELVLLVGGFDGSSWLPALDFYHPSLDHMEHRSSMRFARSYACAANLNGEIYILGGVCNNVWYDEVESYNPVSNQWTRCPSLNQKNGNFAGVSFDDKIYAIGGGNGNEYFSTVEIFDVNNGKWIPAQPMLHKRLSSAAAEINGAIYAVGGYDGKNYLKSVERFDPRERSWRRLESMSTKRGGHTVAVLNEKLFVLGGYNGQNVMSSVEIFDPRRGSWMMGDSMNDSRGYSAAAVIENTIYAIGGIKGDNEILETVECYKEGHGWQKTNLKAIGKRCFFSAIVL
ncbi:uncharacterized protein LOC133029021 isoform X1 [Cannabis sativa]|uniref:uncharacterized protein LOC133029021 isoform X1 n=2 Tax=Cannabis sativa TaxID=3483 RepID=UPI0029CA49F4|nr:uncharacterized protein LOC133029021 isoform X1 [Cannabis sativa]